MSSQITRSLLTSILALGAGVGLGYYASPKVIDVSPGRVSAPTAESVTSASDSVPVPVAPVSAEQSLATGGENYSEKSEVDTLRTKLEKAEKELKAYHEAEKIEPVYDDPEMRTKLASNILEITGSKEQIEGAFAQSANIMLKDNKDPEKVKAIAAVFNKYYSWESLEPEFVKIYTEVFSADDLQRITKFYQSDSGKLMLEKQPELMGKTMEIIQKQNEKNLPKMMDDLAKILPKPTASDKKSAELN